MKETPFTAFIIASSLPVSIWPLAGLALANQRSGNDFDFSVAAIVIPLVFGLYHLAATILGVPKQRNTYLILGAFLGLLLSSLGTFVLDLPQTVYGLKGSSQYLALIGGPIFYGAVWYFALWPLENRILRNEV